MQGGSCGRFRPEPLRFAAHEDTPPVQRYLRALPNPRGSLAREYLSSRLVHPARREGGRVGHVRPKRLDAGAWNGNGTRPGYSGLDLRPHQATRIRSQGGQTAMPTRAHDVDLPGRPPEVIEGRLRYVPTQPPQGDLSARRAESK